MLRAIIVSMMLILAGTQAMAAAPFDQLFLRNEAQGSAYELAIAQLAQTRATRPEVRTYAATLVNDHETYGAALRDLAQSKGVILPSGLTANGQQRLDRLARVQGNAFDAAFVREAWRINAENIRNSRKEARRTLDPDIRSFVARFVQMEEKHEAGARALSGHTVASRMPVIQPPSTGSAMPIISPAVKGTMPVISPPTQPQDGR
ncbi:MAG: DUF4142 domain-containing protein [Pseudomonadota bacterium]|nr:DUF4142 domain-containing protein [Pseudomonadota bacterium]